MNKKKESIVLELLKITAALFLYTGIPAVFSFFFLFIDVNAVLSVIMGLVFLLPTSALLYYGGSTRGKNAFKFIKRSKDDNNDKYAHFMAFAPYKPLILAAPFVVIVAVSALLGALISGIGGGIFRIFVYGLLNAPAILVQAAGGLPDMQISWAAFVVFCIAAVVYAAVFCVGYIITGLRLRQSEADMIREMKTFDFKL